MKKFITYFGKFQDQKKVTKMYLTFTVFGILLFLALLITLPTVIPTLNKSQNFSKSLAAGGSSWREDFNSSSLNTNFWSISNWSGLGSITNLHQGIFQPDRVSVSNGYLSLKLTQENGKVGTNANGVISRGGEISSLNTYGYGTYEWRARMSSTALSPDDTTGHAVSGQISGLFNYVNNSQSELDFEVEGQYPNQLELTTWNNTTSSQAPGSNSNTYSPANVSNMANQFKTYKYVWSPGEVKYYVDDVLVADHTTHVPSAPASFLINHWGTDSTDFGGLATVGADRYLLVDWARYTAPGDIPLPSSGTSVTPTATTTLIPTHTLTSTPIPTAVPTLAQATNSLTNGSFENSSLQPWYFTVAKRASGTINHDSTTKADGAYSTKVNITRRNSNLWYVQLGQVTAPLTKGRTYTITFWGKASKQRNAQLDVQQHASPWTIYFSTEVPLTTAWTKYTYTFTSPVAVPVEFNYNLAQTTGSVWVDNVSLQ
ncbi:MAG: carbohydrate binding domain-containing protein [Candidatus Levyibacteriota bacterium]